jgi:hypothetical protein
MDPNLVHWQRVEQSDSVRPLSAGTVRRPPSYDGNGEGPDAELERQIREELANATRQQESLAMWRPSMLPVTSGVTSQMRLLEREGYI